MSSKSKIIINIIITVCILLAMAGTAWAGPRILSVSPANLSQPGQVTQITAVVYNAAAVSQFRINNNTVSAIIYGNEVSYTQQFNPGLYNVYLAVTDGSGQMAEKTWSFFVNDPAKPSMLPNNANCARCHPSTMFNLPGDSPGGHLLDSYYPDEHPDNCAACHYFKAGQTRLIVYGDGSDLIVKPDGLICSSCHTPHTRTGLSSGPLFIPPKHDSANFKGTWSTTDTMIQAPRESLDCQYCHQPGTKVRIGHDLISDHDVDDSSCTSCHTGLLTVIHNTLDKAGQQMNCDTCHQSTDPVVQNVFKDPQLARAGSFTFNYNFTLYKSAVTYVYDDLNLSTVSLTVYGPSAESVSPEWTPGPGLEIKRVTVDGWKTADQQYILAWVDKEAKWYTLPVADEGNTMYGRYPSTYTGRVIYLPKGTTKIKTMVRSSDAVDSTYSTGLDVREAYYNKAAKCTDCHAGANHDSMHTVAADSKCTVCHKNTLTQEHNRVSKDGRQLNCSTCHDSTNPKVRLAIQTKNKNCLACHTGVADQDVNEMPNTMSNTACVNCHKDYQGLVTGTAIFNHKTTNCMNCHIGGPNLSAMWNCRYCHNTTYYDTYPLSSAGLGYPDWTGTVSGFKSYRDPLRGAPLGSKTRWMAGHFAGGSPQYLPPNSWPIDANFDFHTDGPHVKHKAVFPENGCSSCHGTTLTSVHAEKFKTNTNPAEDFEDGSFAFNFTGIWAGDWARVAQTAYSGSYSFKSGPIATNLYSGPSSIATTETNVSVVSAGTVSFWYKVTNVAAQLSFYVDGNKVLTGTATNWTQFSYPVAAGSHTLKWTTGGNSAYIDDLSVYGAATTYTMNCDTCHLSSDNIVQTAIANHDTNCLACHPALPDHDTPHNGGLDNNCQTCHLPKLTQEHLDNPKTAAVHKYDCKTCHSSSAARVQRAIVSGNISCAACHPTLPTHKVGIADQVPADIVLYPGFAWSNPMEAALFAGEPTIPYDYEQGRVVFSNRKTDVTCLQIRQYYKTEMAAAGWTVGPDNDPPFMTSAVIQFTKEDRKVFMRVFNTENVDGSGQQDLGYRIELWYE